MIINFVSEGTRPRKPRHLEHRISFQSGR